MVGFFTWLLGSHASRCCAHQHYWLVRKIRAWLYFLMLQCYCRQPNNTLWWWHLIHRGFYHSPEGPFLLVPFKEKGFLWFKELPEELASNLWDSFLTCTSTLLIWALLTLSKFSCYCLCFFWFRVIQSIHRLCGWLTPLVSMILAVNYYNCRMGVTP